MPDRLRALLSPAAWYVALVVLFLYVPIGILIVLSFSDSSILSFPIEQYTLKWYMALLHSSEVREAVVNSVVVGVVSSLIATVVGAAAGIAAARHTFPGRGALLALAGTPLVMPAVVLGVGLLVFFRSMLGVELSLWLIGAAHVLISIPTSVLIVMARLAGLSHNLEEAAMDLGATPWQTLFNVIVPLSLPAMGAAFLTAFTTSFDEYAMTTLITGTDTTLPVYIYAQLRFPRQMPVVLALGTIVIVVSALFTVAAEWLRRLDLSQRVPRRES